MTTPEPSPRAARKPSPDAGSAHAPWARAVTWLGVTAVVVTGVVALWVYQGLRGLPGEMATKSREVLTELGNVAAAFRSGTVTTRFISHATQVSGSHYLQFATLKETEVFQRSDEATLFWGYLDLPALIVEATAPVEYTYYLDLDEPWELRLDGETIEVLAPAIRFNTPAVDASAIEYTVRTGSLVRDEAGAITRLKAGITRMAKQRARENTALVRELGRRKTEEFVEVWLARSFGDGARYRARVVFADETDRPSRLQAPLREGDGPS